MGGITFSHPVAGTLQLRLAPTSIEWTYVLNTNTTQTYAGEVIQLLSVDIDTLTITGQFGKEGPHGRTLNGNTLTENTSGNFRNLAGGNGPYTVGLTQMTEYFRRYFEVAAQGRDTDAKGHYNQIPMKITYDGALDANPEGAWTAYPTSFPSYKRTNVDFAPDWQVVFQVEEADYQIKVGAMNAELTALKDSVGYIPNNVFSDPMGLTLDPRIVGAQQALTNSIALAQNQATTLGNSIIDVYSQQLPAYTDADLNALLFASGPGAGPAVVNAAFAKLGISVANPSQTSGVQSVDGASP